MKIDSATIIGSIILFIVTTVFISFTLSKMNIKSLEKDNKKVDYVKVIGISAGISALFASTIAFISLKVDKENLKNAKKSSPL